MAEPFRTTHVDFSCSLPFNKRISNIYILSILNTYIFPRLLNTDIRFTCGSTIIIDAWSIDLIDPDCIDGS